MSAITVVGYGGDGLVSGHGVNMVGQGGVLQVVVVVYRRPGCHAAHSQVVVPGRYDAGHGGGVTDAGVDDLVRLGVVVVEGLVHVVAQVCMGALHSQIDHGDIVTPDEITMTDISSPPLSDETSQV